MSPILRPLFLVGLALGFVFPAFSQAPSSEWKEHTVRFVENGSLKDVFDSGLRPYRFPRLENILLESKRARLTFRQHSGKLVPAFPAQNLTMRVLEGGLLSSMELTKRRSSIDDARTFMRQFLHLGDKTEGELEAFLAAVNGHHLDFSAIGQPVFSLEWTDADGSRYGLSFRASFHAGEPLIAFMTVDWSQVRTERQKNSFYTYPIPPPPGYENAAMEAPSDFGPESYSRSEASVAQNDPAKPEIVAAPAERPVTPPVLPAASATPQPSPAKEDQRFLASPAAFLIIGLVLLLASAGIWKIRRGRSGTAGPRA